MTTVVKAVQICCNASFNSGIVLGIAWCFVAISSSKDVGESNDVTNFCEDANLHFYFSVNVRNLTATHKISNSENKGTPAKCAPISLNINVNSPNLVYVCVYKLPITGQNLAKKGFA